MAECEVCGEKIPQGKRFCDICAPSEGKDNEVQDIDLAEISSKDLSKKLDNKTEKSQDASKIENLGDGNGIKGGKGEKKEDGEMDTEIIDDPLNNDFDSPSSHEESL